MREFMGRGRQPLEIGGRAKESLQPRRGDGKRATAAPLGLINRRHRLRPRGFRPMAIDHRPSGAGIKIARFRRYSHNVLVI
jgi:hypothetical protein